MVLILNANLDEGDKVTLELESDVTWNGFLVELAKKIATPVDLVKLYKTTDVDRRFNYRYYITDSDKAKKLIDIAGLQADGEYDFDLELPCAAGDVTDILALNKCQIIGCGNKIYELNKSQKPFKIALDSTGWRKRPKFKKLKFVTKDGRPNEIQYKKYLIEEDRNGKIQIDMIENNMSDPLVTFFGQNEAPEVVEATQDDILYLNNEAVTGKKIVEGAGGALVGLFNFVTSVA